MRNKNKIITTGLLALVSAAALLAGTAHAASGSTKGYAVDSTGNIWRDRAGDCWHGSDWTEADKTVVGCDGVTLDTTPEIIVGEGTGVITQIVIPAGALFAFDKSDLNEASKTVLNEYKENLGPDLTDAYMVVVAGHTDSTGNSTYNKGLSLRRAESVANYLVSTGVREDAIRVIGRGSSEPIASNETREGRMENRRVDLLVVAELRALDTIVFPSATLFERRQGSLSAAGLSALEANYTKTKDVLLRASYIEIVGHTDNVGSDDYNMKLSEQRAAAVRDFLIKKGVDDTVIITTGMGESMPVASNSTPEGRAQNRHVEVLILGRVKE
jgi:OOP family OmpA-OmpF porin